MVTGSFIHPCVLESMKYIFIEGAGHIQFIFAPAVIPFITKLGESGEFTSYRLEKIGRMTSTYAVRMYEILVQYLSIGKRDIELDWLRKTLCIEGEYLRVMDFKTWVLDVAMTQINTHSDIIVSYQQRKTGRIITHFDFTIMDKAKVSAKKPKPKVKNSTKGSDPRAKPGESQDAFDHRMLEKKGQQQLI